MEKALKTLEVIERFACGQHDHVSFAKAWMLLRGGARPGQRLQAGPTVGAGPAATAPRKRALKDDADIAWWMCVERLSFPRVLVVWACGPSWDLLRRPHVLVGCRAAQGHHVEHVQFAAQSALGETS